MSNWPLLTALKSGAEAGAKRSILFTEGKKTIQWQVGIPGGAKNHPIKITPLKPPLSASSFTKEVSSSQ